MALIPLLIAAASRFLGLKDLQNPTTTSATIPATAIGALVGAGPLVASVSFTLPKVKSITLTRIRVNGQDPSISNYWLPLQGALYVNTGQFQLVFITKTSGTTRTINVGLNNPNGGAATFPSCTFDVVAHFYDFPWA